jgi:hypothetical protein
MKTPYISLRQSLHKNWPLIAISIVCLGLYGYWTTGPAQDYDHMAHVMNRRYGHSFSSPGYSKTLFHTQSFYSPGRAESQSKSTAINLVDGKATFYRRSAFQYRMNSAAEVLAVSRRTATHYEANSLRSRWSRKIEANDAPQLFTNHSLILQSIERRQIVPQWMDLEDPQQVPLRLDVRTPDRIKSDTWPYRFDAFELRHDRFMIHSCTMAKSQRSWIHLYSQTTGEPKLIGQWQVWEVEMVRGFHFQIFGDSILTINASANGIESHSIETGELVLDEVLPEDAILDLSMAVPRKPNPLSNFEGRSVSVVPLLRQEDLTQTPPRQKGVQWFDLVRRQWIDTSIMGVIADEFRSDPPETTGAKPLLRKLLIKTDKYTLTVMDTEGKVLSEREFPRPVAYSASLGDNEYLAVVGDPLFGYQIQIVNALSGTTVRTIRPLAFWRILLFVSIILGVACASAWVAQLARIHEMPWVDLLAVGLLYCLLVWCRQYQMFSSVLWAESMWHSCVTALLVSLLAVIVSRLVFGRGRFSYKLLGIELFHLACYFYARDAGIREGQLSQETTELIFLFSTLLGISILARLIGFAGVRETAEGTSLAANQFGVLDIMVIMISVVLFLVISKPNASRYYEWLGHAQSSNTVKPMLLIVMTSLFCGYSRMRWWLTIPMLASSVVIGICYASYVQMHRSTLEIVVVMSAIGMLTWLMVLPFGQRGWRVKYVGIWKRGQRLEKSLGAG